MIKGKDLKQAKLVKVELDKERPLTFDFNALCELQEHYIDPFVAINGIATGDVKCLRALMYASLLAGHLVENENDEFDLTINQAGRYLGQIMTADKKYYEEIFEVIVDGITLFFPQLKQEDNSKEEKQGRQRLKKLNSQSQDNPIAWDWYYYLATQELNIPEERFWRMTMRKLNLIWDMKKKMTKPQQSTNVSVNKKNREIGKNERVTIDQLDLF